MEVARKDILSVNIHPELKERLKEWAKDKRWSMSQAAEYLIEKGLWTDEPSQSQEGKSDSSSKQA